jgi:hypothetical protein
MILSVIGALVLTRLLAVVVCLCMLPNETYRISPSELAAPPAPAPVARALVGQVSE